MGKNKLESKLQEQQNHNKFNSITQKTTPENQNQTHNSRKEGIQPINQKRQGGFRPYLFITYISLSFLSVSKVSEDIIFIIFISCEESPAAVIFINRFISFHISDFPTFFRYLFRNIQSSNSIYFFVAPAMLRTSSCSQACIGFQGFLVPISLYNLFPRNEIYSFHFGEKYSDTVTVNEVNSNVILFAAYAKFKKKQFLNVEIHSRGN